MRTKIAGLGVLIAIILGAWWLLFEGNAPDSAPGVYDAESYRSLIAGDLADLPTAVHMEVVGTDSVPGIAAEAGKLNGTYEAAYTSFAIVWADGRSIVIGGAVDAATAKGMQQSAEAARFDQTAYDRMTNALSRADQIYMTHAHPDHIIGIIRHEDPSSLVGRLKLRTYQKQALSAFPPSGSLPAAFEAIEPFEVSAPERVAPGVVLVPNAGHTPASQSFYIKTSAGDEFMLIGDIVWTMSNLDALTTRPRLLQYMLFDPPEDRPRVLAQVRALHDLRGAQPNLTIVPSHDRLYLEGLVDSKKLKLGFPLTPAAEPQSEPSPAQGARIQ